VAGEHGQPQAPNLSQGWINDLTPSWAASIRARIEKRKREPIAASSGNAALDEAALSAVRAAGRFPCTACFTLPKRFAR
jgi:protein TonB